MKRLLYSFIIVIAIITIASCEKGSVGTSITQTEAEVIMDSSFTVKGASATTLRIASRTATQLLGAISSENYGDLHSDFVTQFMPSSLIDTAGVTAELIDSVKLVLRIPTGGFTGDSIVPMGLTVYELTKQLPSPIYSDFDATDFYDASKPLASTSYVATNLAVGDTLQLLPYRDVTVPLPVEFGRRIFNAYKNEPPIFNNPTTFAQQICPGFIVQSSFGSGRMMYITRDAVRFYYRAKAKKSDGTDTIYNRTADYLAASPEVLNNNIIELTTAPSVAGRIDAGQAIVQAPIGCDVSLDFPTEEIMRRCSVLSQSGLGVLNTLYFEIPAEPIAVTDSIMPPPHLLLIRAADKQKFFDREEIVDIDYFLAAYDSGKKLYVFENMRDFILDIIDEKGLPDDGDSQLVLCPVLVSTEASVSSTNSSVTNITPYINAPAIARLKLADAKIKVVFSAQRSK